MKYFRSLSIRHKIVGILLIVTVISLVAGFGVHVALDVATFREDAAANTALIARVVGDYCVVDIVFEAKEEATTTLTKLSSNPDVETACLYDREDRLFAHYEISGKLCSQQPPAERVLFQETTLRVMEPIRYQKQDYGKMALQVSTEALNEKIRDYLSTMVLLTAVMIVIAFLLALMLQRVISAPILALTRTTRQISSSRDYSLRVQKSSEDEIGMLTEEFNQMLGQIELRKEERDRVESALRESENRYRNLVESSPEAIFLEQSGSIQYGNQAALRLSGYSLEELKNLQLTDLLPNVFPEKTPFETVLIRKGGEKVDVEATLTETILQGNPALQVLARDITESRNLRVQAERVQRLAALGEFSAIIAHEIRNSLGAITLNLRTLLERLEIPEQYRKTFLNMELGAQRIQDVVNGILDFARPTPPSPRWTSVQKILESSVRMVETELEQSCIEVIRNYSALDPPLYVDPVQLGQVFVNLLFNARNAIHPREGGKITLSTRVQESTVEVVIADNGSGIPKENLVRIFDPFFTTMPSGAGLGLAVVARILDQHGAVIDVESKQGDGSVFTIRFRTGKK